MKRGLLTRLEKLEREDLQRREWRARLKASEEIRMKEFVAAVQKHPPDELHQMWLAKGYFSRAWSTIDETEREQMMTNWAAFTLPPEESEMCKVGAHAELTQWVLDRVPNKDLHDRHIRAVEYEMLRAVETRMGIEVFLDKVPDEVRRYYLASDGTKILWRGPRQLSVGR